MNERDSLSFLHDAELSALSISRKDSVITMDFVNGSVEHRLKFYDVIALRIVDLIQQNVVSQAFLSSSGDLSDEYLIKSIKWACSLSDSSEFINDSQAKAWIERIKRGELSLFVIEPSWGAELVVVFGKLDKELR